MKYPVTRRENIVDVIHGTEIADPYRWLEDANSEETASWVAAQNAVTMPLLRSLAGRDTLRERLANLWNYERVGVPWQEGGKWFWTFNPGLANQAQLMVGDAPAVNGRILLDPNLLSTDGTAALAGTSVSPCGTWLAYSIQRAGSDWQTWHVRNVETGDDTADFVEWAKFTGASWAADASGFYYSRYAPPKDGEAYQAVNENHVVYFHALGTPQADDVLVYATPDQPKWNLSADVTEDGDYLMLYQYAGTDRRNGIAFRSLTAGDAMVQQWLPVGEAAYSILGNDGPTFYILTDNGASRKRIVRLHIGQPFSDAVEIVPESNDTCQSVSLIGETLIVSYLRDARSYVECWSLDGIALGEIILPGIGTSGGFAGTRKAKSVCYAFTGYTAPAVIYHFDVATRASSILREPHVPFDRTAFVTTQHFATSKDGTRVPYFQTQLAENVGKSNLPVYQYGYGGFDISLTPGYSPAAIAFMERGGVYVVANLRGGGEYGDTWHVAGTKLNKQNVFDDFIAVSEDLITRDVTEKNRIAIAGGSNGGLLVGACSTQRPDLYGAAIPAVGVLDMLRFHLFTIGWAWQSDYGNIENEDEFRALLAYSPYHTLVSGTSYPATLVTTSDHDDRVVPAHSFKYAAALQFAQNPDAAPTLIRIETQAGHGAGKPISKVLDEQADVFAFVAEHIRMEL
jgi:prolyl oligopeptidase